MFGHSPKISIYDQKNSVAEYSIATGRDSYYTTENERRQITWYKFKI